MHLLCGGEAELPFYTRKIDWEAIIWVSGTIGGLMTLTAIYIVVIYRIW